MSTIIETERTILRPFTLDDIDAVFEFGSNDEVNRYTGTPSVTTKDEARNIITDVYFSDTEKYGYARFAVHHKADDKVIGFAGLKYLPEYDLTDIGYRYLPKYWGHGLATETNLPLIKYGFETLGLNQIIGIAMAENIASYKVLEKLGLNFWKIDEYDGDGGDHRWYKLEKKDYPSPDK